MNFFKTISKAMLVVMAVAIPFTSNANETKGKPNVLIDYFWRPANIPFSAAEQLRSYVMEGITNTNRVELIDVDSQDALAIAPRGRR